MKIISIHHVQLAIWSGGEELAREFYGELLGLEEVKKPAHLAARGGVWFEAGDIRIHLGVDPNFIAAKKAHPALLIENLDSLISRCQKRKVEVTRDLPLAGFNRIYLNDPFGNRIEIMEVNEKATNS